MPRLKELYKQSVVPAMMEKFGYKNAMEVPRLNKVVINMGVGDAKENPKFWSAMKIWPYYRSKACWTVAKRSVASFKLRAGMKIGTKVTLRGDRMYEFDRLLMLLFRGFVISGAHLKIIRWTRQLCTGIREQLIFPEISMIKLKK